MDPIKKVCHIINKNIKNYDDFIEGSTMLANDHNLNIMLNDTKHNFGHGYCLAWTLINDL